LFVLIFLAHQVVGSNFEELIRLEISAAAAELVQLKFNGSSARCSVGLSQSTRFDSLASVFKCVMRSGTPTSPIISGRAR